MFRRGSTLHKFEMSRQRQKQGSQSSNDTLSCVSDNQSSEKSSSCPTSKDFKLELSPGLKKILAKCITPIDPELDSQVFREHKGIAPRRNQSFYKGEIGKICPAPVNFNFKLQTADFDQGSQQFEIPVMKYNMNSYSPKGEHFSSQTQFKEPTIAMSPIDSG